MDRDFYAALLDRISDGVYFVDRDRRITYWNAGAERITGYTAAEVLGRSCSDGILRHVSASGRQLCLHGCPLAAVMCDGRPRDADVFLHHKDGHRVPVHVQGSALTDEAGDISGSVEVFGPRAENPYADSGRRSRHDVTIDPVTGLPVRAIGELHLDTLVAAVRSGATTAGLLFIDADRFKTVNDTFGHVVGDHALRMVARSMANGLRRGDLPVRWGGEEFVALLPGADELGLHAAAERVRVLVENSWLDRGAGVVRLTVSVGATMLRATDTAEAALERADRLMYRSKEAGRNRVTGDAGVLARFADAPTVGSEAAGPTSPG